MNNEHHVVPNPAEDWDIKKNNAQRSSGHFDRKHEAIARARQIIIKAKSELIVHNKDGQIKINDSHGNDPRTTLG